MSAHLSPVTTTIDYEREGKQVSYLKVPNSRNDSAWGAVLIPIIVVKNGEGPTLYLNGGSHGGEYEGTVCLLKLARELQPENVQGRVIIIPSLNLPAVMMGVRLSPIDNKDMNRVFPGQWDGTITQVIAHYVHETILPLCDAVLDLHSGGYSLDLAPYISMHYLDDQDQMERTFAALRAFNAPLALVMQEFSGAGLLDYAVEGMGKIFLCAELGGGGRLAVHTLKVAEIGVRNLLKHFNIIEGDPLTQGMGGTDTRFMEIPNAENYHIVTLSGIYESLFELGQWVEKDQILGYVHFADQPTREPEQIVARCGGMLIGIRGPSQVTSGDCVAVVGIPASDTLV
jgi:N-alpha-acetyl-L-2,4-diaminobutyrate deacetylase